MSATDIRVSLGIATAIADELVELLGPFCQRIEIAGSIRRCRLDIGDIDLLCQPMQEDEIGGLFGEVTGTRDLLSDRLDALVKSERPLQHRLDAKGRRAWGPALKRGLFQGLPVDIRSVTDPASWGFWLLISTGPAEFNKRIVTDRWKGGLLPPGFEIKDGFRLYRAGGRIETPTEESVFEALSMPYLAPSERR